MTGTSPVTAVNTESSVCQLALRAYPRRWRQRHGEELLGVLLDVAQGAGRTRPRVIDLTDVALRGLSMRWCIVRDVVPADVRRRAAILAIASAFALSVTFFLFGEWGPWVEGGAGYGPHVGPFLTLAPLVYLACSLTFAATVVCPRTTRFFAGLTLALAVDEPLLAGITGWTPAPRYLLILLALLSAMALSCPGAADAHERRELAALGAVLTGISLLTFGMLTGFEADYIYRSAGPGHFPVIGDTTGLVAAGLALALFLSWTRSRAWGGAVALNAVPWIIAPTNFSSIISLFTHAWLGVIASAAALAVLGLVLHRSGARLRLRGSD